MSSLAVVGPDGRLIGNFSASEMRSITAEQFGALALPVGEFLARGHRVREGTGEGGSWLSGTGGKGGVSEGEANGAARGVSE